MKKSLKKVIAACAAATMLAGMTAVPSFAATYEDGVVTLDSAVTLPVTDAAKQATIVVFKLDEGDTPDVADTEVSEANIVYINQTAGAADLYTAANTPIKVDSTKMTPGTYMIKMGGTDVADTGIETDTFEIEAPKPAYTVTVANGIQNGSLVVSKEAITTEKPGAASLADLHEGDDVYVQATADTDYRLDTITYTYEVNGEAKSGTAVNGQAFKMPAGDVEITATFVDATTPVTYGVSAGNVEHGSIAFSTTEGATEGDATLSGLNKDDKVYVIVTPDADYELETLTYTYEGNATPVDIKDSKEITMPEASVVVTATFKSTKVDPEFKLGDADGNGDVDINDALLILDYLAFNVTEDDLKPGADPDGNGDVDINDALDILNYLAFNDSYTGGELKKN